MIYEYRCLSCRNYFALEFPVNKIIKSGKHIGARCKVCKSSRVKKVISYPNVIFSGPGFYVTDKGTK